MRALTQFLQNNPLITLGVFIISVLSGLMGIILMWGRFYNDFLSKSITLPVYVYIIIIFLVALAIIFWPAIKDRPKPLQIIKGESFGVQRIFVDGKRFENCKFRRTELVFRGEASVEFVGGSVLYPKFTFDGPAATTIKILTTMYKIPEMRPLIENTLKNIREGKHPIATPPSNAADK